MHHSGMILFADLVGRSYGDGNNVSGATPAPPTLPAGLGESTFDNKNDSHRGKYVNLKLKEGARYQSETNMRVGCNTPLGYMMKVYAKLIGKPPEGLRFITWDGHWISEDDTATEVSFPESSFTGLPYQADIYSPFCSHVSIPLRVSLI